MIDIIALHALWGLSIPLGKKLLVFTSPIMLTGVRMTIAGAILMLFNAVRNGKKIGLQKKYWFYYTQIIVIGVYLRYIMRYWGLKYIPSIKMGFLVNSTPFLAALFSYIFLREKLTKKKWIGLFFGMCGYGVILVSSTGAEKQFGEFLYISWPEVVVFISMIAECYYMILAQKLLRDHNHSASVTNGMRMLGGGLLALITAFAMGSAQVSNVPEFSKWLALLIITSNIICHNYAIYLLKYYTITFVMFTAFMSPLFTGLYGVCFLGEVVSWHYIVGALGIIGGLFIFHQDELVIYNSIKYKTV